jgi:hypothetical protein
MFQRNPSPPSSGLESKPSNNVVEAGKFFEPEGGGDIFYRNFGVPSYYPSLQPRKE